jgi:hypothetical protein
VVAAGLGKSHAALPADEEEIAPLEEFERDVGERLRPLGADGATCIIDEHEVAIGQQRTIAIAGIGLVLITWPSAMRSVSSRLEVRCRCATTSAP